MSDVFKLNFRNFIDLADTPASYGTSGHFIRINSSSDALEFVAAPNGTTNLSQGTRDADSLQVVSSSGTNLTLPKATTTLAGLMSGADKTKLDGTITEVTAGTGIAGGGTSGSVTIRLSAAFTQLSDTPGSIGVSNAGKFLKVNTTGDAFVYTDAPNGTTNLSISGRDGDDFTLESSSGSDVDIPSATANLSGLMTASDKTKLDGVAAGAEVNVQSDWNAGSGDAQILNKPDHSDGSRSRDGRRIRRPHVRKRQDEAQRNRHRSGG